MRCSFDSWFGKILWRRKWKPTSVFVPGKSHEQRSLKGYSPRGHKRVVTKGQQQMCVCVYTCVYICIKREIYYNKLVHMIMEAKNCRNLPPQVGDLRMSVMFFKV